jgi:hypothetical protein
MPMSAPTTAPTQRSDPELTRPKLSALDETAHCSAKAPPKENEMVGGLAQG